MNDDMTIGEIGRAVTRIETGQKRLEDLIPSVEVLKSEMLAVKPKVESAAYNAAFIAGGMTAAGWIVNYLLRK